MTDTQESPKSDKPKKSRRKVEYLVQRLETFLEACKPGDAQEIPESDLFDGFVVGEVTTAWVDEVVVADVADGDKWIANKGKDGEQYRVVRATMAVEVSIERTEVRKINQV
tara:strand:+ start:7083 stop:7415 length:333 start_codon:yes stop_codon:yes gene_type:complete